MRLPEWLDFFRRHNERKIFHIQHLRLLTGIEGPTLRVSLRRLTHAKVIQRICRGFYANPFNPPTLEEASAEIYKPSYISLESALHRHGVLSQAPFTLTCVTTRLPRTFRTRLGAIQYRQIKKAYFVGFVREDDTWLAEPEKALVDFLYLHKRQEIQGILSERRLQGLSRQKIRSYAEKMKVHPFIASRKRPPPPRQVPPPL